MTNLTNLLKMTYLQSFLSFAVICAKSFIPPSSCSVTKDAKLSGANSNIPSKLSFNGAKCKKMFKKGSSERFDTVWKETCEAERNTINRGQGKEDR